VVHFLERPAVEAIIMLLIFADVALVTIEAGVDHHLFCIGGVQLAGISSEQIKAQYAAEKTDLPTPQASSFAELYVPSRHASDLEVVPTDGITRTVSFDAHGRAHLQKASSLGQFLAIDPHQHALHKDEAGHAQSSSKHPDEHLDKEAHGAHGGHHHGGTMLCEDRDGHGAHHLVHICHQLSILILCVFTLEIFAKMACHFKALSAIRSMCSISWW